MSSPVEFKICDGRLDLLLVGLIYLNFARFDDLSDAPWIVHLGQDGAQLDPTEVSPSDDATMVESEANLE
ncbi:hypothetical protein F2Q70_00041066 [Brassica cretica]|uniref:Uncharacterized protein n=1 Tax=Brassica cretica TaxID=69181 RepID=A0A8S9MLP3_BRACR|nr:hypothetical protein F2Q70_00041066 [Brassica cretica]KAF2619118.1 hypothetical protein F2Q68_00041693 [Brassica cretica]